MDVEHVVDGATQALANRAFTAAGEEGVQDALDAVLGRLRRRRLPAAMADAAVEAVAARTPTRQQLRLVEALIAQAAKHDPHMQALVDHLGEAVTRAADGTLALREAAGRLDLRGTHAPSDPLVLDAFAVHPAPPGMLDLRDTPLDRPGDLPGDIPRGRHAPLDLRESETAWIPAPRPAPAVVVPDPSRAPISWELDVPVRLAVAPGRPGRIEGQLFNLTARPQRVRLEVQGEPKGAVKVPHRLDLPPHGHALVPITITAQPDAPLAGSYAPELVVRAENSETPALRSPIRFAVEATPAVRLTWPPTLPLGDFGADADPAVVTFTNTGNTPFRLGVLVEVEGLEPQEFRRDLEIGQQEGLDVPAPPRTRVFTSTRRLRVVAEDAERHHRLEVAERLVPVPPTLPVERRHLRLAGGLLAVFLGVGAWAALGDDTPARTPVSRPAPAAAASPSPEAPTPVPVQALPACPGVNQGDVAPASVSPSPPPQAQALIGGAVFDGVNPGGKYVVLGSDDHRVHAFDPDTLQPVWWSSCLSGPIAAQPVVLDGGRTVHAVTADGTVATFALDAKGEQEPLRTAKVPATASVKPSKAGNYLLVTSGKNRGTVTLLDAETGAPGGTIRTGGSLRQNPQSVHASRIYLADGASRITAYDLPRDGQPLRKRAPLETGAGTLSLEFVSVPARQAESDETSGAETVMAAGTVTSDARHPGRLMIWPTPTSKPVSAKLPGTPAARLGLDSAGETVLIAQRSGEQVLLSRVDPDSPDDVRTVTLPVTAAHAPTTRPARISAPQLAGSTVAIAYGRCVYAGPADLSRIAPIFCTDADLQGPPALRFDETTGETLAYVAGRDGRLSRIAL